jgi:translation initiation factor 1
MTARGRVDSDGSVYRCWADYVKKKGALVYSTDRGQHCPGCRRPKPDCVCADQSRPRSGSGIIVSRETKGRKGAGATLIAGLPLSDADLKMLAKNLKTRCGVGGSVKDGVIELQGDQRDKVLDLLEQQGFKGKRSGG